MIDEHRTSERCVPMRRSALHGTPFMETAPPFYKEKRLVRWCSPSSAAQLLPELDLLSTYNVMLWSAVLMRRLLTVRTQWSRR
jgi:hypothetical protein